MGVHMMQVARQRATITHRAPSPADLRVSTADQKLIGRRLDFVGYMSAVVLIL